MRPFCLIVGKDELNPARLRINGEEVSVWAVYLDVF